MIELFTLTPSGCLYQLILNKYRYLRNKLKIQLAIYIFNFAGLVFCYFIFSRKKTVCIYAMKNPDEKNYNFCI